MNSLDDRRVQSGPRSKTRPLPDPSDPPRAPDPVFPAEGNKKVLTNLEKNPWLNYRFSFSLSFFFCGVIRPNFFRVKTLVFVVVELCVWVCVSGHSPVLGSNSHTCSERLLLLLVPSVVRHSTGLSVPEAEQLQSVLQLTAALTAQIRWTSVQGPAVAQTPKPTGQSRHRCAFLPRSALNVGFGPVLTRVQTHGPGI